MSVIKQAQAEDFDLIMPFLLKNPGTHAWAIQDLRVWPEQTKLFFKVPDRSTSDLDYLLMTGHPGAQRLRTMILGGSIAGARDLLAFAPKGPWVIKETPETLLAPIREVAPQAQVYFEHRMETTRSTFRPRHSAGRARRLTVADATVLAAFQGAPPQAAAEMTMWILGAHLFGIWDGDELAAIASTFVRVSEVCEIVAVATKERFRGRGLASEVTSALVADCLEFAPVVSLTVLRGNLPALAVYGKLGFQTCEDRIWVSNGTNSRP